MSPATPLSQPRPSIIARLVELREAADALCRARHRDQELILSETQRLVEAALAIVPHIHDVAASLPPGVVQAETFVLRELAAARRHHELATRSSATCRAACELSLRALTRALDSLLRELIPHSLVPAR